MPFLWYGLSFVFFKSFVAFWQAASMDNTAADSSFSDPDKYKLQVRPVGELESNLFLTGKKHFERAQPSPTKSLADYHQRRLQLSVCHSIYFDLTLALDN